MLPIHIKYCFISLCLFLVFSMTRAQDNVGIGTTTPHPSAILQVDDSSRGVLIPRTDTMSIANYVNSLSPSPGISNGLMIFDTLLNTYVYYDEPAGIWRVLLNLVGPQGPRGPQGPQGPAGDTGLINDWRDSLGFDQRVLVKDTCGDWFFDASSGQIWRLWCDTLGGTKPRRWVDTVLWDKPIGMLTPPDERIFAISQSFDENQPAFLESMANDSAIVVMKNIPSLSQVVTVEPDEVAYVFLSAHGTVGKAFSGPDISYAQYDFTVGTGLGEYYRSDNVQHITSVGPNNSVSNQADLAAWYLSADAEFEGDLTDPIDCRCGTPWQKTSCTCSYNSKSFFIQLRGGNRYSGSANTTFLILGDSPKKETTAHMNMLIIIRRNPGALPRKR